MQHFVAAVAGIDPVQQAIARDVELVADRQDCLCVDPFGLPRLRRAPVVGFDFVELIVTDEVEVSDARAHGRGLPPVPAPTPRREPSLVLTS